MKEKTREMGRVDYNFSSEYKPLPEEFIAVGVFGIILFCIILAISSFCYFFRTRVFETRIFFAFLSLMSLLELPRYISIAIESAYDCVACYSIHIIADWVYFACLAIVTLSFARILELGAFAALLYSKNGIFIAILLQGIMNFAALIVCSMSTSVDGFFASKMYTTFTIFDILQNCTYTGLMSFYGVKLILRFRNLHQYASTSNQRDAFAIVLHKVTFILLLVTFLSFLRLSVLIVKLTSLSDNGVSVTSPNFSLYGFLWFTLSDFLPRGISSLGLAIAMQTYSAPKPNSKVELRGTNIDKNVIDENIELQAVISRSNNTKTEEGSQSALNKRNQVSSSSDMDFYDYETADESGAHAEKSSLSFHEMTDDTEFFNDSVNPIHDP